MHDADDLSMTITQFFLRKQSNLKWEINYPVVRFILSAKVYTASSTNRNSFRHVLRALADDKIDVTKKLTHVFGRVENILRKEENAV